MCSFLLFIMNDPRDFLPKRYRHYLENDDIKMFSDFSKREIKKPFLVKKNSNNNLASLFIVFFLLIGIFSSFLLSKQTQDNRQQAFVGDPYLIVTASPTPLSTPTPTSTIIPTPSIKPTTEGSCNGQGNWFNDTCYLYWEVLPGGTHVVVPPNTINNYKYPTFQSVEIVEFYLINVDGNAEKIGSQKTEESTDTIPTPIVSNTAKYESGNFFNQLDDRWKNIYIEENIKFGNVGCGVTSVANLTGVSPDKVLGLYDIGNANGITANGTSLEANAEALKKLGYETSVGVNGNGVLEDEVRQANLSNNYSEVVNSLNSYQEEGGWQIMLNGNFGNLGGGGHWVVVQEIDTTNDTVTVIDPNGGELKEYSLDVSGNFGNDEAITPKRLLLAKKA